MGDVPLIARQYDDAQHHQKQTAGEIVLECQTVEIIGKVPDYFDDAVNDQHYAAGNADRKRRDFMKEDVGQPRDVKYNGHDDISIPRQSQLFQ